MPVWLRLRAIARRRPEPSGVLARPRHLAGSQAVSPRLVDTLLLDAFFVGFARLFARMRLAVCQLNEHAGDRSARFSIFSIACDDDAARSLPGQIRVPDPRNQAGSMCCHTTLSGCSRAPIQRSRIAICLGT